MQNVSLAVLVGFTLLSSPANAAFSLNPLKWRPLRSCLQGMRLFTPVVPKAVEPSAEVPLSPVGFDEPPHFEGPRIFPKVDPGNSFRRTYAHGVEAEFRYHRPARADGHLGHAERQVVITRTGPQNKKLVFVAHRSDRGLHQGSVTGHYPKRVLSPSYLKGKMVLDLQSGDGSFVRDLRKEGVQAYGLDIFLSAEQLAHPSLFIEADAHRTGLAGNQFDVIFSNWNLASAGVSIPTLKEVSRLLKVGGSFHVAPALDSASLTALEVNLKSVPGLELGPKEPGDPYEYIHLRRTR